MSWVNPLTAVKEKKKPEVKYRVPVMECAHRWRVLICAVDHGSFYTRRERSFCTRCKAEA